MANSLYSKARQAFLDATIDLPTDTIKAALVTNGYTPNLSTHDFYDDVSASVVGTPQTLASKTITDGVFDAADVTFTAVASGSTVNYILIYKDTGTASTSPLIALIDTATGLPVLTNGGNITITWDNGANKIFAI